MSPSASDIQRLAGIIAEAAIASQELTESVQAMQARWCVLLLDAEEQCERYLRSSRPGMVDPVALTCVAEILATSERVRARISPIDFVALATPQGPRTSIAIKQDAGPSAND